MLISHLENCGKSWSGDKTAAEKETGVEKGGTERYKGSVLTPGWLLAARITDALSRLINYRRDDGWDAVREAQHPKKQQQQQQHVWTAAQDTVSSSSVITLCFVSSQHMETDHKAESST